MKYIRLVLLAKVKEVAEKVGKMENFIVKNFHCEQDLALIKIFLKNFLVAHFIAILLLKIS